MKIEHIAMYVSDIEQAKDFFQHYFGAQPNDIYHNERTGFRSYFLTFDNGARLEIMNRPDCCNAQSALFSCGYAHLAFSAGSREKVDELTKRLSMDGYEVISGPRVTGDGYYESCILGFEGNIIEITV